MRHFTLGMSLLLLAGQLTMATPPDTDRGLYALWYGDDLSILETPYIKGGQIVCQWKELEKGPGTYDFSILAERLGQLQSTGRKATLQINGNLRPDWLFTKVPFTREKLSVQVRDKQGSLMFWHPVHREAYLNMLKAFARFLETSPHRKALIGIRLNFNPLGTEHLNVPVEYRHPEAWTVPEGVDPGVEFTDARSLEYQDAVVATFIEYLSPLVKVFVRNNIKPDIEKRYRHLFDAGKIGWFHTSSEAEPRSNGLEYKYIRFHKDCRSGTTLGYAEPWASAWGDHGGLEDHRPFSPPQWNYWRLLIDLHCGISYIGIYDSDLGVAINGTYDVGDNHYNEAIKQKGYQREFEKAFQFAAKYVGYHNSPEQSPGAWVAFRDAPEILARNAKSPNQLKLDYFTNDYNFLMERLPDETIGTHNVGPDNERYGAWARVLPAKKAMRIAANPDFMSSLDKAIVRVIYLDEADKRGNTFVIGIAGTKKEVSLNGTGTWQIADLPVVNPNRGDEVTIHAGNNSICLHMVEVMRR